MNKTTGNEIRQMFIDFFVEHRHTFVPSASLVPGGDATLLFTNAGMVQFKDVFLGTDKRPYTRAVNSQKCMRVAGKHNDLDDVGRDDYHHTFFEMLGNWSFGDYYKKEAITWSWQLLTEVWGLPKDSLYATCFKDEKGEIPDDDEAAEVWRQQPGFNPDHVLFFGRKENFWEMAEVGPCGPCSEIHIDRGIEYCDKQGIPHNCTVNGDCTRFLELWNNVFIQYNRLNPTKLEPLPAKHVDTGMGFERIVSIIQDVPSNYRTDLLWPLIMKTQELTGHTDEEREANFTPYRVIADHARAAAFLIADGVVPGNTGRNYVTRMIIRRAARFGSTIGLHEPFLALIAEMVIQGYGNFYPELIRNQNAILDSITREEKRFQRTVESGIARLEQIIQQTIKSANREIPGGQAFDLYATYGLPLEITRDIAREQGLEVDQQGFRTAMEEHRLASGAGAFGEMTFDEVDIYRPMLENLQSRGLLGKTGVEYDPYSTLEVEGEVLALVVDGQPVPDASPGEFIEVILPRSCFYVESGGQVSDTGRITSQPKHPGQGNTSTPSESEGWEIRVTDTRRPVGGVILHVGEVVYGQPKVGDWAIAQVDADRRHDIMRNHTTTHLLHAALRQVLGDHARQAGSLVAPDRLRFDFNHPEAVSPQQLEQIEKIINLQILNNHELHTQYKPLKQAIAEGATALFGEKYSETVRNVTIDTFSNELCGGTHVHDTSDIGLCLIVSEGSVATGIRRIEAVTGRGAYELVQKRFHILKETASLFASAPDEVPQKTQALLDELSTAHKQIGVLRQEMAASTFDTQLGNVPVISGVPVFTAVLPGADAESLRQMTDRFRQKYPSGICVLASVTDGKPMVIAAVTEDLVKRSLNAGELVKFVAAPLGGGGGGRPTLAQAGGKEAAKLSEALASVLGWVESKLKG
jgi:alanyl-tRNA synthetase